MAGYYLKTAPTIEPITVDEAKAHLYIDTDDGEPSPTALTCALAAAGAGNLTNGVYRYRVTFVTADGETEGGTISASVTVADKTTNGKVALTAIQLGGSSVTSRKVYRTEADGSDYKLLATISDNTTATYTDNIADASLGAAVPSTNTTEDPYLNALITAARQWCESFQNRVYITQTWQLILDSFPCGDVIELPNPPLQSVTSIKYYDVDSTEATFTSDDYEVDIYGFPGRIVLGYSKSWPSTTFRTANGVIIEFVAGYGAAASSVPATVKHAMKLIMGHWNEHRESAIIGTITAEVPQSAKMLLSQGKNFK